MKLVDQTIADLGGTPQDLCNLFASVLIASGIDPNTIHIYVALDKETNRQKEVVIGIIFDGTEAMIDLAQIIRTYKGENIVIDDNFLNQNILIPSNYDFRYSQHKVEIINKSISEDIVLGNLKIDEPLDEEAIAKKGEESLTRKKRIISETYNEFYDKSPSPETMKKLLNLIKQNSISEENIKEFLIQTDSFQFQTFQNITMLSSKINLNSFAQNNSSKYFYSSYSGRLSIKGFMTQEELSELKNYFHDPHDQLFLDILYERSITKKNLASDYTLLVVEAFESIYQRIPDISEFNSWMRHINNSEDTITLAQLVEDIRNQ
jgi:hypothetical protein